MFCLGVLLLCAQGCAVKGRKWYCAGFLKGSSIFLDVCLAKCSRAIRDGEKGMASAFLVLGMTWDQRAGALLRPETPGLQEYKEFGKEEIKRPLEECSGLCWGAHTQVRANRSAPVSPQKAAGTRCPPYK